MSENTNTTIASINQTVLDAVNATGASIAGFESVGDAVVKALTEREHSIVENIVNEAEVQYGYGSQAQTLVETAGLAVRPAPEPEPVVEENLTLPDIDLGENTLDGRLAKVESTLVQLLELAKRHLGANL